MIKNYSTLRENYLFCSSDSEGGSSQKGNYLCVITHGNRLFLDAHNGEIESLREHLQNARGSNKIYGRLNPDYFKEQP